MEKKFKKTKGLKVEGYFLTDEQTNGQNDRMRDG